jgi:hypothetical protein
LFFELTSIVELFAKSKTFFFRTEFTELFEKVNKLVFLNFLALVPILSPFLPNFHEANKVILIVADRIV